jgi:hypothetical protein
MARGLFFGLTFPRLKSGAVQRSRRRCDTPFKQALNSRLCKVHINKWTADAEPNISITIIFLFYFFIISPVFAPFIKMVLKYTSAQNRWPFLRRLSEIWKRIFRRKIKCYKTKQIFKTLVVDLEKKFISIIRKKYIFIDYQKGSVLIFRDERSRNRLFIACNPLSWRLSYDLSFWLWRAIVAKNDKMTVRQNAHFSFLMLEHYGQLGISIVKLEFPLSLCDGTRTRN